MPTLRQTRDRDRIEAFLRRDRELHVYELGDLDPFFWPLTTWWAAMRFDAIAALALLYRGPSIATLLLLERDDVEAARWLLGRISRELPHPFYSHLSPGLADALGDRDRTFHGTYRKMTLRELAEVDTTGVDRLGAADLAALQDLYARAYPGNWFDPRMLDTDEYFGVREAARVIGVAGVHVVSAAAGVAALGNIVTDPSHRRRGIARRTTAALVSSLLRRVDTIALNVSIDNAPAIRCYRDLGFDDTATYEEWMVAADRPPS
jgi:ribosomal protein S18 acetylase RimI-like enzyme